MVLDDGTVSTALHGTQISVLPLVWKIANAQELMNYLLGESFHINSILPRISYCERSMLLQYCQGAGSALAVIYNQPEPLSYGCGTVCQEAYGASCVPYGQQVQT